MARKLTHICALVVLLLAPLGRQPAFIQNTRAAEIYIYSDLVVDEVRNVIYGSCTDCASIHILDLMTLAFTGEYPVTIAPSAMDLSPDGNSLVYTMLSSSGVGALGFIDLISGTVQSTPIVYVRDMPYKDVVYGLNDTVYAIGEGESKTNPDYLHAYNVTTHVETWRDVTIFYDHPRLVMSDDRNQLFATQGQYIYSYDVSGISPSLIASKQMGAEDRVHVCSRGNRIFTGGGAILWDTLGNEIGHFNTTGQEIVCSQNSDWLMAIDNSNYIQVREFPSLFIPLVNYTLSEAIIAAKAIRPGDGALLISTSEGIKVIPTEQTGTYQLMPLMAKDVCPLLYFEDFEDTYNFWPLGEDAYVRTSIRDGEYSIYSKNDQYIYTFQAPSCARRNYMTEAHVRWQGYTGYSYGLVFGVKDNWDYYYLFDISADFGAYRLYYRTPSGFQQVIAPALSPAISGVNGTNHLKVKYFGGKIELIINGTQVFSGYDSGSDQGGLTNAGVVSMAYSGEPYSDARFDRFRITTLDTSGNAVSSSPDAVEDVVVIGVSTPLSTDIDWPLPPLDMMERHP